jgi:hypothetical protein
MGTATEDKAHGSALLVDTKHRRTTMLDAMLALFKPHAAAILGDETGAEAVFITAQVLEGLDSDAADWLFDNWDSVLDGLAA